MADQIFVVQADQGLVPAQAAAYDSEEVLQHLLVQYPDLLAGGQINPGSPRRWVLLRREAGIPDSDTSTGRWSVDHLFVDQDAIPTLVEVKRSTDTRIRREVVGQMLDYAANGVVYWPIDRLRGWLRDECGSDEVANARLMDLVGPDVAIDEFWATFEKNLRDGRVRLLFVADVIPPELQRIIEFLNDQLTAAEVLGVEVRNYEAEALRALVPKVIGRTATAQVVKPQSDARRYDELLGTASPEFKELAERLTTWAQTNDVTVDTTKKALRLMSGSGRVLLWAFPNDNGMQLSLESLRNGGGDDVADSIVEVCSVLSGKMAAVNYPGVRAPAVISSWDLVVERILAPLAAT